MSAASKQLDSLQAQAEVLTQRYDQAQVDEQRADAAYQVTESRLKYAQQAQEDSQRQMAVREGAMSWLGSALVILGWAAATYVFATVYPTFELPLQ